MSHLTDLLACPRCEAPLDGYRCRGCGIDYPVHADLPWLFADPGAAVSEWRNRWQLALVRMEEDLERVTSALSTTSHGSTRRRLETLASGYRRQMTEVSAILEPLRLVRGGSQATLLALRTRLPSAHGLLSYEANVHRDWFWGDAENKAALDAVQEALNEHPCGRVLVLGAGAGRLAYDLHQHSGAAVTVALDMNPLLAYVGHRVSHGEAVTLVEFPLAPRTPESAAVERRLQAPAPARPGLHFLLADALRPPLRSGVFDVVVTPWLLDVVDEAAHAALPRINGLLRDGGIWIHHGSVAFDRPDPAERLTLEELAERSGDAGFTEVSCSERRQPYMDCPDSRHGRVEWVVTLAARKVRHVAPAARHQHLPDWIARGRSPIPALPAFRNQAMTTKIHAYIMSLIDGKRTLEDMARILEEQRLMERQEAETALRGFLIKMNEEAARAGAP